MGHFRIRTKPAEDGSRCGALEQGHPMPDGGTIWADNGIMHDQDPLVKDFGNLRYSEADGGRLEALACK